MKGRLDSFKVKKNTPYRIVSFSLSVLWNYEG
jgi:hypothetical protein